MAPGAAGGLIQRYKRPISYNFNGFQRLFATFQACYRFQSPSQRPNWPGRSENFSPKTPSCTHMPMVAIIAKRPLESSYRLKASRSYDLQMSIVSRCVIDCIDVRPRPLNLNYDGEPIEMNAF